tara:strand:+ start:385 stop:681 length:297 start_codon:yes stop_codon:yes gene_type:complete
MPPTDKPTGRRNVPLFITMPPAERARLVVFAAKVGRPHTWVVRDALSAYLDTVEPAAEQLATLRARVEAPIVDLSKTGKTEQLKKGRPFDEPPPLNVR